MRQTRTVNALYMHTVFKCKVYEQQGTREDNKKQVTCVYMHQGRVPAAEYTAIESPLTFYSTPTTFCTFR